MKDFVALSKHHISSSFGCSFFKDGPFPASFSFFSSFPMYNWLIKICQCLDSNCRSLVLERTALPTEPQPLPGFGFSYANNSATEKLFSCQSGILGFNPTGLFNLQTTSDSRLSASELTEAPNWFHYFEAFPLFSNWSVSILNWKGTVSFFLTTLFWLALAN